MSVASTAIVWGSGSVVASGGQQQRVLLKPKRLNRGDTIGLITPASAVSRSAFEKAIDNLSSLGFEVKYSENMRVRKGFLAGTDRQRLDDLHGMFADTAVHGVVCARGGYGSGRLLPYMDYNLVRRNPKVLIGYSDITALLFGIHQMTGLVCFHGPVGASDFTDFTRKGFHHILTKKKASFTYERPKAWQLVEDVAFQQFKIVGGEAEGRLVGGNLSLLCSLLGTPYDIDYTGKLVFIEEVGESPYRVDRMLTQLLNAGKFAKAKGIAMGVFYGCETKPDDPDFGLSTSLKSVLLNRFAKLNIPVLYGLPIGHIADNATLPLGIKARLDVGKGCLQLLESAVI